MEISKFSISTNNECKASHVIPEHIAIKLAMESAQQEYLSDNIVIIGRYQWLVRNKLKYPEKMDMPNLCLTIKRGRLKRAFFSNVLTHIIKKQKYFIQVIN